MQVVISSCLNKKYMKRERQTTNDKFVECEGKNIWDPKTKEYWGMH